MRKPRLLLVDDHAVLVEGLRALLQAEFDIVGAAGDGRSALALAERLRPDLVLLDISMPGLNGLETARRMRDLCPNARVIILTMHSDPAFSPAAFEAGVAGYVLKQSAATELITALREVNRGRRYFGGHVQERFDHPMPDLQGGYKTRPDDLTARQCEVLQLLAEGRVRKEIAAILSVSVKTVEYHREQISRKLGMRTGAELTAYAIRHGIVSAG